MPDETNLDAMFEGFEDDISDEAETDTIPGSHEEQGKETEERAEESKPDKAEETKPTEPEPKYKIKYNGKEEELTLDELTTLAQKGRNYDHVVQERDGLKNAPEMQLLDGYAKAAGMTRTQYMDFLRQSAQQSEITKLVEEGVPEAYAKQLVELKHRDEASAERTAAQERAETEKRAEAAERTAALKEFTAAYPGVTVFPREVLEDIKGGMRPLAAYQKYEIAELKAQIAAKQKNADNREKAAGSVADKAAPNNDNDSFLSGWGIG